MTKQASSSIEKIVQDIMKSKGNAYVKSTTIAEIIYKHLIDKGGDAISHNKLELAFITEGRTILIDEDLLFYLKKHYDFTSNTSYKQAMEMVHNMAIRKYGDVKMFYHSVFKNGNIYIGLKNEGMLKITQEAHGLVKIGTDGIYIQSNNTFPPHDKEFKPSIITLDQILEAFTFDESFMSSIKQKYLLKAWFFYSLFDDGNCMRPILLIMGCPGSGKTLLEKIFKGLLYGFSDDRYLPNRIPQDEHELSLFLKNQKYLFVDELNEDSPDIKQVLRIIATGIEQRFRPKYMSNLVSFTPKIWLVINSIDPRVSREFDIAERLLMLQLSQRDEKKLRTIFGHERSMYDNLDKCRAYIWKDIVNVIQRIMVNLKTNESDEAPLSNYFRNKDFVNFCYNAFPEERELCLDIFNNMNLLQNEHSSEMDPLLDMLEAVIPSLEANGNGRTKEYKAGILLELMRSKNREFDITLPKSAKSLGKRFRRLEPMLSEKFGFRKDEDAHTKTMLYSFKSMEASDEEVF